MTQTPAPAAWQQTESPFHAGARAVQARVGVEAELDRVGRRTVRAYLTEQLRAFFPQLPFVLVGSADGAGQPWASFLCAPPGFVTAPTTTTLWIARDVVASDPLLNNLKVGRPLGVLGIELATRRRNRVNGYVATVTAAGFELAVTQAFGNCPKYIQARTCDFVAATSPPTPAPALAQCSDSLTAPAQALIARADTAFIATAYAGTETAPVEVSHRGGKPGFVRIDDAHTLTMPDFVGNFHFRTLGNLSLYPRAGLLFLDFANGDLLQIAADVELIWDGPLVASFAGAERVLRFRVRTIRHVAQALPLRFSAPSYSPFLAATGAWTAMP